MVCAPYTASYMVIPIERFYDMPADLKRASIFYGKRLHTMALSCREGDWASQMAQDSLEVEAGMDLEVVAVLVDLEAEEELVGRVTHLAARAVGPPSVHHKIK